MSKKTKRIRISKKKVVKHEGSIFRDRKPGSYNQLWDWNTFEDIEIKGSLKFG